MSLRNSYAAVLQLLRTHKGLSQQEISGKVVQSHVSHLESAKTTATVDVTYELAVALKMHPAAFFALILASHEQRPAREMLLAALEEIDELGLADAVLPTAPRNLVSSRVEEARKKWVAVQELKREGLSQSEAAKRLDIPDSTLRRLWHQSINK
ncbi:helix-turn-helix domain-containing protein [Pseudomonas svalbardensis]|uniref:helix-turn-helix domain-containing protein n=1 Tax=Pseudomonas svalbardensis TaxID=3042029 RepID=UPI0024B3A59C|nr:helix-turn-helix transcriptional regulator [Pseudomonas sp. PMCC200367]